MEAVLKLSSHRYFRYLLYGVYTFFLFEIFFIQAYMVKSDNSVHYQIIQGFVDTGKLIDQLGNEVVHPGFHVATGLIAKVIGDVVFAGTFVNTMSFLATLWMIRFLFFKEIERLYSPIMLDFFAIALNLTIALYVPNYPLIAAKAHSAIYHNPTLIFAKPFAFLFFYYASTPLLKKGKTSLFIMATLLLVTVLIKPNFFLCFFPMWSLYTLWKEKPIKETFLKLFLVSLPTVLCLLIQLLAFSERNGDGFGLTFFGIWSHYQSVPLAILSSLLFPIVTLAFYPRLFRENASIQITLAVMLLAILQFSFLTVEGPLKMAGDWGWGKQFTVHMLFVVIFTAYIKHMDTLKVEWKKFQWRTHLPALVFSLHLMCGSYFILRSAVRLGRVYLSILAS